MAKGGRGGRRGGGVAKGELTLPNGTKIEFDGDLVFGGLDKAVPEAVRKNLDDWETKRYGNKVEFAMAWNADGTPIGKEAKGGKGSVRTPFAFHHTDNSVFTHNHPRGDGMLGGTFSNADLHNFTIGGNVTSRATAKEGTYSISKTKNFDAKGFTTYYTNERSKVRKNYENEVNKLGKSYKDSKISYDDYMLGAAKSFNTYLVQQHNVLLKGQKQYGYTYTLEKRK